MGDGEKLREPVKYSDEELTKFARSIALSVLEQLSGKRVPAGDIATVMAIACAEVHCQCHGVAGLEQMRTAIDLCERDLMRRLRDGEAGAMQ